MTISRSRACTGPVGTPSRRDAECWQGRTVEQAERLREAGVGVTHTKDGAARPVDAGPEDERPGASAGELRDVALVRDERQRARPRFVEGLEKQAYTKAGEPDKTSGLDHVIDAGGYFICHKFPVVKRTTTITALRM